MNYQKIYDDLMISRLEMKSERYKARKQGVYFEGHHRIPKHLGGTGTSKSGLNNDNIVLLTAREHFLAHWMLWRIHQDRPSALAFHMMTRINKNQNRISSSRAFEEARIACSITNKGNSYAKGVDKVISEEQKNNHSIFMKGRYCGEKNSFFGKKHSEETILKLKNPKSEEHKSKLKKILSVKIECPNCHNKYDNRNAKRWHFENCKQLLK